MTALLDSILVAVPFVGIAALFWFGPRPRQRPYDWERDA